MAQAAVLNASVNQPASSCLRCRGNHDDDRCIYNNWQTIRSFTLSVPFSPYTHFFLAVAPFNASDSLPTLRLSVSARGYSPPPPPSPPYLPPSGSWANPIAIASLPFLSTSLSVGATSAWC